MQVSESQAVWRVGSGALLVLTVLLPALKAEPTWRAVPGGRLMPVTLAPDGRPGFTLLTPAQTGVTFTNVLPAARFLTNQVLPNGSGVAAGDVDGDGWCDLYFCGLNSDNRLYRNRGNWRFEDVTASAGVACPDLDATGAGFADLDGDGDLDLLVNSLGGGTRLFFNTGQGRFTPGTQVLNPGRGGTSLALADADGDGDLDLYLANYRLTTIMDAPGTRFTIRMVNGQPVVAEINGRPPTDPEWTNRFQFRFENVAGGRGTFAREELGEPDLFLRNDGRGHFDAVSWTGGAFLDESGEPLRQPPFDWGLSVLFRDLTGDGLPDLYVCNDFGTPDRFWQNTRQGRFRAVPRLTLRQTSLASMGVDAADLDRDGDDDFMVVEMLSRDHGRRLTQRTVAQAQGTEAGEITGRPQYPRNTLFRNRGDGTYAEIAQYAGVEASEWSWAPLFVDVDLDGFEDLLVPNGFERDNMNADVQDRIRQAGAGRQARTTEELRLRGLFPRLDTANLAFRNRGDLRFEEVSHAWGFDTRVISQGACLADLDNDGDLEVVVNNLNAAAGLYRNEGTASRLAVRLIGQAPNTRGVGSRITVTGGPQRQSQEITSGGRYLSSDDPQRCFAAGMARALTVTVRWLNGRETTLSNVPPNHRMEVIEPPAATGATVVNALPSVQAPGAVNEASAASLSPAAHPTIRFAEVDTLAGHKHQDASDDDFERQPLLPHTLSQLGPGAAWWDGDGDGRDDLLIAGGRGGKLAWYRNLGPAGFERVTGTIWDTTLERDACGFAVLAPGSCLLAFANAEDGVAGPPGVIELTRTNARPQVPLGPASFGPLAVADYDGDGELDLFVGGRVVAGRYPAPTTSTLWKRRGEKFELDAVNTSVLPESLVSSAIWTDLTGDGWPELVLACDWGPIRLFRNARGTLVAWNPSVTGAGETRSPNRSTTEPSVHVTTQFALLSELTGWWNGVAAGDLDNDGRLDLVASNWGTNTRQQRWRPGPLRVWYGDFNGDGTLDLLEAHIRPSTGRFAPDRRLDIVARSLPGLTVRFPTHAAWAETDMDQVLGEGRDVARYHEVTWLESAVFLNRGDHFEVRPLPAEAQLAPAFAVCIGDADGDGNEDLFLSQNFFGVDRETSRLDAGRGLWLRGDGRGGLTPVPGQDSGVRVYGEQRGAALADFDADGRLDFVVTQHRAETRLFRNLAAKPGLRVRLAGSAANPYGIGAVVRVCSGDTLGPAREVRSGSGYWSQDSPVLLLGTPTRASGLQVRWPGGRVTEGQLASAPREAVVHLEGNVEQRSP